VCDDLVERVGLGEVLVDVRGIDIAGKHREEFDVVLLQRACV
jgi:hypothetical protein